MQRIGVFVCHCGSNIAATVDVEKVAEELGKVATLYKNVGDGIDIETASEDIVSTMKAFKIEASDAITIVDKLNEVGKICCP